MSAAVVWQGFGTAAVGHLVEPRLSTVTTGIAFLVASIIAVTMWRIRTRGQRLRGSMRPPELIRLNLVTAGAFASFYVAATLVPPTVASVLETAVGPLVLAVLLIGRGRPPRSALIPMLVAGVAVGITVITFRSAGDLPASAQLGGVILSVIAGACALGVVLLSHRLASGGTRPLELSPSRFHLTWLLCGALSVPVLLRIHPGPTSLAVAAIVGAACISGPVLLLQWGVTIARPVDSTLVLATLPAVVMLGDYLLSGRSEPSTAVGSLLIVGLTIVGVRRA